MPEPTCGFVLKHDYVDYLGTEDAQLVAEHTRDAAEHLVAVHKAEGTELDTTFTGEVPEKVVYHAPATSGPRASACGAGTSSSSRAPRSRWSPSAPASTAPGACAPRTTTPPAAWRPRWPRPSTRRAPTSWPATAPWPTGASSRRPARSPSTRCRWWRAYGIPTDAP
ncbi:MAG: hypothetical protein R2746_17015 [Acidimicrobiales bacterium]